MKINSKGFTIVEVLLSLIVLTLIGFTGFYVFNANKKDNNRQKNESSASSSEVPGNAKKYLEIKEFGVKIPLDTGEDISYEYKPADTNYPGISDVTFYSKKIDKMFDECTSESPFGYKSDKSNETIYVDKYHIEIVYKAGGVFNPTSPESFLLKQLKDYNFYIYDNNTAGYEYEGSYILKCTNKNSDEADKEIKYEAASLKTKILDAFRNAEPIN